MNISLHQTHHTIGDFAEIFSYLKQQLEQSEPGLHLFPELYLTGYPLQDLCLTKSFYENYLDLLDKINELAKSLPQNDKCKFLIGGLDYKFSDNKNLESIENIAYELTPGQGLKKVYIKRLLPDYDIFDERKYFTPGNEQFIFEFSGKKIALLICEDMWPSLFYQNDPVQELIGKDLDLVVNLSASPFNVGKQKSRLNRAKEISHLLKCPYVYVNRVGGEDEILFDGQSFVVDADSTLVQGKMFESDLINWQMGSKTTEYKDIESSKTPNTWESLFNPLLDRSQTPATLEKKSESDYLELLKSLQFGVLEYARKCGFKNFTIALSGGMDSALVLTILKLGLNPDQNVEAIYMPGKFSAGMSHDLSLELCENLGIPFKVLPIKFLHSTVQNAFQTQISEELTGVSDENIQSRLRGALIYARSNQTGSMVINTSNKSELAVGYSTQYGDSVGAISMLGDLYKSEVFELARFINDKFGNVIPEGIITRPPSAELRPDQKDTDSLPSYERLDAMLEGILSYRLSSKDLEELGFDRQEIERTVNLYRKSEFKRFQFCPIIKTKAKSFGFGYRIPTSKNSNFYL